MKPRHRGAGWLIAFFALASVAAAFENWQFFAFGCCALFTQGVICICSAISDNGGTQ